jgi:hypothetical protein
LLEPDASKGARPVLRGAGRSNAPGLPGEAIDISCRVPWPIVRAPGLGNGATVDHDFLRDRMQALARDGFLEVQRGERREWELGVAEITPCPELHARPRWLQRVSMITVVDLTIAVA